MKTDNHNDWTDAFRESFPEAERPAAGGWEAVAGRMRRAAARRRAAVAAAAVALPLAGGLLFLPSRPDNRDIVAEVPVTEVVTAAQEMPLQTPDITGLLADVPATTPPALTSRTVPTAVPAAVPTAIPVAQDPPVASQPPQEEHIALADDTPVIPGSQTVVQNEPYDSEEISEYLGQFAGQLVSVSFARRHTVSVGVHAGSTAAGAATSLTTSTMAGAIATKASNNNFFNNTAGTILQHDYVHDLPVSLGLSARYAITDRISLESGLDFTRLHSKLDDLHSIMYFAGIPLRLDVKMFSTGPFEVYAGIGGEAEKCLKATFGGMASKEPKIQWSGSAFLGAQTRIARGAWLYFQPELSYYFTKTALISYRTENRLGVTINAGLRFDIAR